jgi:hypothetical protein
MSMTDLSVIDYASPKAGGTRSGQECLGTAAGGGPKARS